MKAFRIGYITTFSFLLILTVFSATMGFYPAPKGQKMPEYPVSTNTTYDYNDPVQVQRQQAEYKAQQDKYQSDLKSYQEQQKTFIQDKVVPYARNVFVVWITAVVVFEIIGLLFIKMGASLVGAGFAFTGFFAVIFGPLGGLMWYVSYLVSSFARGADQQFSSDPLFQAIAVTSIIGAIALAVVGYILERFNKPLYI